MLAAVIFDFDGVIVDTEPLHYRAFQEILTPLGLAYSWDDYLTRYIGFDDRDAFREVFRLARRPLPDDALLLLIEQKARAFQTIAAGAQPYPGVVELVREIAQHVPLALCSGALPSDIAPIIHQLGISDCFALVVTAADVTASKPDPESYALTLRRLAGLFPDGGITPENCLAIEDTPAGIASATGAGLKVLAVTNSYPAERLSGACTTVASLAQMDLASLRLLI